MLLSDLIDLYFAECRPFAVEKTRRKYGVLLSILRQCLNHEPTISDMIPAKVLAIIARWGRERNLVPQTTNGYLQKLQALGTFGRDRGLIATWHRLPKQTEPLRTPVAFSAAEIRQIFAAIQRSRGERHGIPRPVFWRAFVSLALDSGERIHPLTVARWEWLRGDCIIFPAAHRKGSRCDHVCRLHPDTLVSLARLPRDTPYIWREIRSYHSWRLQLIALLRDAGIADDRAHKFHGFRRTLASAARAEGLDATAMLGHSAEAITRRYVDPTWLVSPLPPVALVALRSIGHD